MSSPPPTAAPSAPDPVWITTLSAGRINYGAAVSVSGTATPGYVVDLYDAPAPSGYRVIRSATVASSGAYAFTGLRPGTDSRFQVKQRATTELSNVVGVTVRDGITIAATRTAVRRLSFRGVVSPHRGGVLVTVYQIASSGRLGRLGSVRTASSGAWTLTHTFPTNGRRTFLDQTNADSVNASRQSARVAYSIS